MSDNERAREAIRLIQWMAEGAHNGHAREPIMEALAAVRAEEREAAIEAVYLALGKHSGTADEIAAVIRARQ